MVGDGALTMIMLVLAGDGWLARRQNVTCGVYVLIILLWIQCLHFNKFVGFSLLHGSACVCLFVWCFVCVFLLFLCLTRLLPLRLLVLFNDWKTRLFSFCCGCYYEFVWGVALLTPTSYFCKANEAGEWEAETEE